ncbi:MAG: hypothetical protein IPM17_05490 [Verrucomicrobia bacterium]|nr:hypothetical protein [Verrucomicrobiota bacterium]
MLKCHELIGFVSPALSQGILEYAYQSDKVLYRTVLAAVAAANRVRPLFLERKPRVQRHADMLSALTRPRMEEAAANLLRGWLLKAETPLITSFLDALGVKHDKGVVEEFPATMDDAKLEAAVSALLANHDREKAIIYLNILKATNGVNWPKLDAMLDSDPRLQLG